MRYRLLLTAVLATASLATAQQASVAFFGNSCSQGGLAAPAIGNRGLPQLGSSFDVTYTGPNFTGNSAQQRVQPMLITGFQPVQLPIGPVLPLQTPGCDLWVLPEFILAMPADPNGRSSYVPFHTWRIPNDTRLIGASFHHQWLALFFQCGFAGCDPMWGATSGAMNVTMGT